MAGRKIVRDIERGRNETISLQSDVVLQPVQKPKTAIDCSVTLVKKKKVVRQVGRGSLQDITAAGSVSPEKVLFLQMDQSADMRGNRKGELIRMTAAGLVVVLILNLVNVYYRGLDVANTMMAQANTGYESMVSGAQQAVMADYTGAQSAFGDAENTFEQALENIAFLKTHEDWFLVKEKTVDSVQGLLEAAKNIASAGGSFTQGIESLSRLPVLFLQENGLDALPAAGNSLLPASADKTGEPVSLTEQLKNDLKFLDDAYGKMELAQKNLQRVSPDVLPPTFRERLAAITQQVNTIHHVLTGARRKVPALLELLGDQYPHRYLVLLQNDAEARPTGGFIGSYILADLNDGYVTKMEFHDVYELDGQFQQTITPPPDIAKVSQNWRMRDSNYSPDFALSAEKAAWFFQQEGGSSVDTVIALNQSFVSDLLRLTGPVDLASLSAPLTAENFQLILSYIIESKLSGEENPKKILQQLIPAFREKLFTTVPLDQTVTKFMEGIQAQKLLFYSRNPQVQTLFDDLNWSGRVIIPPKNHDYLNVINVSIGGNKSDRYIEQTIRHNTLLSQNGEIINEVSITRKHTWSLKDLEQWESTLKQFGFNYLADDMANVLGRGTNKSFVKLYVPLGSELLGSDGVPLKEVSTYTDEEIQKTWFMLEMDVAPSTEKTATIRYKLAHQLSFLPADTYRLYVQKQPGMNTSFFEKKIFLKPGLKLVSQYPEALKQADENSPAGLAASYAAPLESKELYLSTLTGLR